MAYSRAIWRPAFSQAARKCRCGAGTTRNRSGFLAPGRPSSHATYPLRVRPTWLTVLAIVAMLELPGAAHGSAHELRPYSDVWPGVAAALQSPTSTDDDVVRAARSDALAHRLGEREAPVALGHFLAQAVFDPRFRLEASHGVALLRRFNAQLAAPATFWSEFSLATLQQLAGADLQVAETLRRALGHAASEGVPAVTVARTAGIMAHAQQAGGLSPEAKAAFQRLREDPLEREHAIVHLGELAIAVEGIGTALEIWFSHPAGLTIAVGVIVDEADALWRRDPELSYRLVATAISRLRALPVGRQESGLEEAVARLGARARENAMTRGRVPDLNASHLAPPR